MDATDPLVPLIGKELRAVDPAAFFISGRIVRRVIRQDQGITGFLGRIPHRKTYLISRERLLNIIDPQDLGVSVEGQLPKKVILISQPDLDDWDNFRPDTLRLHVWRMLFHARIHVAMEQLRDVGRLSTAQVHEWIDWLGQAAFDEIRSVLAHESYLFPESGVSEVFIEFAATFLELRYFAPLSLASYFPGIADIRGVEQFFSELIDSEQILEQTRIPGAKERIELMPDGAHPRLSEEEDGRPAAPERLGISRVGGPVSNARVLQRLIRRVEAIAQTGNSVSAAIRYLRISQTATAEHIPDLAAGAMREIQRLVERLQAALQLSESERSDWDLCLTALLRNCGRGFWNAEARMLYDLQQVCIDHERLVYVVDAFTWMRTLGRSPLKRPLPNQREVMISKHLRLAMSRLASLRLTRGERELLHSLLQSAAHQAEHQLRERLRPILQQMLQHVPLTASNLPERVAEDKLVEDLCDKVIERGFLDMGTLRDAISKNQLKLGDLDTLEELLFGDQLLRSDRCLAKTLDGVYRRGEFYLRALQRLSSLAFATGIGRFLTKHVAIPFGGAFVILKGLEHLLHAVEVYLLHFEKGEVTHVGELWQELGVFSLGVGIWTLIHIPTFRKFLGDILLAFVHVLRGFLLDLPRWVLRVALLREFLHSPFVIFLRRYLVSPLVLTILIRNVIYPILNLQPSGWDAFILWFAGCFVVLNSRLGRNVEELSTEWLQRTWHRIRVGIFIALFDLVMETFKQILEWVERVLYAVDEWLRFKSGESNITLAVKAVLGLAWSVVTFVVRFCITLLIEPQINPIKHFPVVTVSHKIILPLGIPFATLLKPTFGPVWANTIATTTVFLTPGVFGFLVWELKENWKLYIANRATTLKPVPVGHHGETIGRLLRPGFHSGTVPRLFVKLRRAERVLLLEVRRRKRLQMQSRLQHVAEEVQWFVEREFCKLLRLSRLGERLIVHVEGVKPTVNSLEVQLRHARFPGLLTRLVWQFQSEHLIAGILEPGWLNELNQEERQTCDAALRGLYKLSGVDLIREQIIHLLPARNLAYDISELGLTVWPERSFATLVYYELDDRKTLSPRPRRVAAEHHFKPIESKQLLFERSNILWNSWVQLWEEDRQGRALPPLLHEEWHLLPEPPPDAGSDVA